jgi:hypothetical protein
MTATTQPTFVLIGTVDARHVAGPERKYTLKNGKLDNLPTGTYHLFASSTVEIDEPLANLRRALDIAHETIVANHEWHFDYDDHGGYEDSDLHDRNKAATSIIDLALRGHLAGGPTDADLDALDSFALHALAPRGRESVREFARAVLARYGRAGAEAPEVANVG